MDSALIVSKNGRSAEQLEKLLLGMSVASVTSCSSCSEARRLLIVQEFGLYVVNTPLEDEFGGGLARTIAAGYSCWRAPRFLRRSERKPPTTASSPCQSPLNKELFWTSLKLLEAANRKLQTVKSESRRLRRKIEDIRLVDRAKCLLVSTLSMTEPEAHRYIEKQAMDLRMTKKEVAQEIVNTYES